MKCRKNWKGIPVIICTIVMMTIACGGQQAKTDPQAAAVKPDPPLTRKYQNIVVSDLTATPEIMKDFPEAINTCQANMVSTLENKKTFSQVALEKDGIKHQPGTLTVKTNVSDMRIVGGAARFWGGAFAGSSFMNIDLKLVDAATGKVVREKSITSANNSWAASWTGGSSDRSLPSDMGKIIAEYVSSVIPQ